MGRLLRTVAKMGTFAGMALSVACLGAITLFHMHPRGTLVTLLRSVRFLQKCRLAKEE
jgi:hypothetical protein